MAVPTGVVFHERFANALVEFEAYLHGSAYDLLDPEPLVKALSGEMSTRVRTGVIGTTKSFLDDDERGRMGGVHICEMEAAAELRVCHFM